MPRRDTIEGGASVLDLPTDGDIESGTIGANGNDAQDDGSQGASVDDGEQDDNGEQAQANGAAKRGGKREPIDFTKLGPDEMVSLNVRVPNGLRTKLESTATGQEISIPQLVTRMLADAYDYTLPEIAKKSRKKYASDEERKAALKKSQERSRTQTKALLAAVEEGKLGDINLEALVAEYLAKQEAEKAAKEAASAPEANSGAPEANTPVAEAS